MKQRYKLFIEYKGTNYSGWQKQPNAITVEEEIEKAFAKILQQPTDVIGQGRTDSGVHAEKQVAHADIKTNKTISDILYALRGVLPKDICVWKMEKVDSDFHARFDAKSRRYRYQILTRPSPLLRDTAIFEANSLNLEWMKQCARMIKGTHDFINFSKANKNQNNTVCEVYTSTFTRERDFLIVYRIEANRFIHNMVRRLVGTMLKIGTGKIKVDKFLELLEQKETNLTSSGITGRGLKLEDVIY